MTIAGRRREVLEEAVAQGESLEGELDWVCGDVREPADSERLIRTVSEQRGRLDVLVNNAGGQFFSPAELIAAKGWRAVWRLNVGGMLNMSEAAYELVFGPAGAGTVVNVTLSPHHGMSWDRPFRCRPGNGRGADQPAGCPLGFHGGQRDGRGSGAFCDGGHGQVPRERQGRRLADRPGSAPGHPDRARMARDDAGLALGRAFNGSTITLDGARDNWLGPGRHWAWRGGGGGAV